MRCGQLAHHFDGVGIKRLSAVDAEPKTSNQHEINTTSRMRHDFLGENQNERFKVVYIWLGEDEDRVAVEGFATHYDTRWNKPRRSPEWRLYYQKNQITEAMSAGDTLFLARQKNGNLLFVVAPQESTTESQLFWLFGLKPDGSTFSSREIKFDEPELSYPARYILDEIGIELDEPEAEKLDGIIGKYGTSFPSTAEFSKLARQTIAGVHPLESPDDALVAWLQHEEALYRRLERRIVHDRLNLGFVSDDGMDVDINGFIKFSLSVQNRRKSRMGHSLEHHTAAILDAYKIRYERNPITERNHRPDFLFPDIETYRRAEFASPVLTMLGVKSTCKERWRQILTEADKILQKHLLTLEPGITKNQTDQMDASSIQLVVPAGIFCTYTETQQNWLWSVSDFIKYVGNRQFQSN